LVVGALENGFSKDLVSNLDEYIRVSGDADNDSYKTNGYKQAVKAEYAIFSISAISLMVALACIYLQ